MTRVADDFGGFGGDFAGLFDSLMFGVFDRVAHLLPERLDRGRFRVRNLRTDFVADFLGAGLLKFLLLREESGFLILEDRDCGANLRIDCERSFFFPAPQPEHAGSREDSQYQYLFRCFHNFLIAGLRELGLCQYRKHWNCRDFGGARWRE